MLVKLLQMDLWSREKLPTHYMIPKELIGSMGELKSIHITTLNFARVFSNLVSKTVILERSI